MIWRNRQTTAIGIIVACLALVPLGAAAEEIIPAQTDTLSIEATVAPWAAVDLERNISLDEEGGQLVGQTGMVVEANFTYNLDAGWSASSPWPGSTFTLGELVTRFAEPGRQEGTLTLAIDEDGTDPATVVDPTGAWSDSVKVNSGGVEKGTILVKLYFAF
jgi:hypothetical protein